MPQLNFSIDFTTVQITGIAQARTAYNLSKNVSLSDIQYLSEVILKASDSYAAQYSAIAPVAPSPIVPVADWAGLSNEILGGSLNGIYNRLTMACFLNPAATTIQQFGNANNIAVAAGKLDQAVAVTQREPAVAASLQLLISTSDYRFTQAEKDLWIIKSAELNFTSLVHLP